jgi:hypothetical protein
MGIGVGVSGGSTLGSGAGGWTTVGPTVGWGIGLSGGKPGGTVVGGGVVPVAWDQMSAS